MREVREESLHQRPDAVSQLADAPMDVMRTRAIEARAAAGKLPLYYTEWSISSNPRDPMHDGSFAAAFAARIAMSIDEVVDGYSYWTFSDIFEENYFPSLPYHGGFGMLNLYGVPKPIYRAFQMLRALGDRQVTVTGGSVNVAAWVGIGAGALANTNLVLINQAAPRHPISAEPVTLCIAHAPNVVPSRVTISRVDAENTNPEQAWKMMGSPEYLSATQVEQLVTASLSIAIPVEFAASPGAVDIRMTLAPQSVNHVIIDWHASR